MKASPLTVSFRAMNPSEFAHFRARAIADYARARVDVGDWEEAIAEERASTVFDERLPGGMMPPDDSLWTIIDTGTNRAVGSIWVQRRLRGGTRSAHILDLFVHEDARSAGVGRGAMQLAEARLRCEGIEEITLNVFGNNCAAISLYRALGFEVLELEMVKRFVTDRRA